jgi:hypothetical protein
MSKSTVAYALADVKRHVCVRVDVDVYVMSQLLSHFWREFHNLLRDPQSMLVMLDPIISRRKLS